MLDGFNQVRKKEVRCSGKLNPDESMFAWKGKSGVGGIPHLSFIKRKPKPLGLELKCVCDGETGIMLFLEIQEGAVRMARKKYVNEYKATTACTLRLIEGCLSKEHADQKLQKHCSENSKLTPSGALRPPTPNIHSRRCVGSCQRWSEVISVALNWKMVGCGLWVGLMCTTRPI